jgi:hypothetical protein
MPPPARAGIGVKRTALLVLALSGLVGGLVLCHRATGAGKLAYAPAIYAVAARKLTYPIKLSPERHHLVDGDGAPFLVHGEAAWSLIVQLKDDEVAVYLEDRRRRGVNLVMVNLVEHKFADHVPRNAYGQAPFTVAGDFSTPNEAYFRHADQVIQRARDAGMVVLLCPAYLGYEGAEEGWYQEMVKNGPATLRRYGRYVGERYRSFDNVIWLEGGDFTPPPEGLALVNQVAAGIKEKDSRHLHAAHWDQETSGAEVTVSGWLDIDSTYTYKPVYLKSLDDYNRDLALVPPKPHFLIESAYEGAPEHPSTPRVMRAQAYAALLTGAAGQIFGHAEMWKFPSGWRQFLASPGAISMTHVRSLFEPRDWIHLVPDPENRILIAGQGQWGGIDYALLAATRDGRLAIAYLPQAGAVTVDLARLQGSLRARWYDPASGRFSDASAGLLSASGKKTFRPPGANAVGDPDWVLVLEASSS